MNIGTVNIPCGCEQRKEIMFTQGQPGKPEAMLLAVVVATLVAAFIYRRKLGT